MNLDRLKALAEAATPGPWQQGYFVDNPRYRAMSQDWKANASEHERRTVRGPGRVGTPECNPIGGEMVRVEDAAFIAAANPNTVLRLVAIIQDLAAVPEAELTFYDTRDCVLCDEWPHSEGCVYRRAVELTQEQP